MRNYQIKFEHRENYLFADVSGQDTVENSISYWTDILNECEKYNFQKVLVYEEMVGTLSKSELYKLNKSLSKLGLDKIRRIAFVDKFGTNSDQNTFGAAMGLSEGIKYMLFEFLSEAEKYFLL